MNVSFNAMPYSSLIQVTKIAQSNIEQVDFNNLVFGKTHTDHMYLAELKNGNWENQRIEPFGNLYMNPFSICLHYGQSVFEGMKAFRMEDGNISIFRVRKHHHRFNESLRRLCMPEIPFDMFIDSISEFVRIESQWVSDIQGASLYLRPFVIATEQRIGARPSSEFLFVITACPTGPMYSHPLRLKLETEYTRAVVGGTGYAKCGGNYAAALYPSMLAKESGYDDVLWTDAVHHQFIEESGMMNVFFVIDKIIITAAIDAGTILDGVTRDSVLKLARTLGMVVQERKLSYLELVQAFEENKTVEAFGTGTAAVVVPIQSITIQDKCFYCYTGTEPKAEAFSRLLSSVRTGKTADLFNWNHIINV